LGQTLPNIRAELHLTPAQGADLVTFISLGTILAYLLVRQADRWGRRRVLSITIAGYTVFSMLTGLTRSAVEFALCQLLARMFLLAEWAVTMVYAAEEFPAARRGTVIGVIQACSGLGAVTCAGVVPLLLQTSLGWRSVYLLGGLPLVIIALLRR